MGTRASKAAHLGARRNRQLRSAAQTEAGLQEGAPQGGQDHRSVDRYRWHQYGYVYFLETLSPQVKSCIYFNAYTIHVNYPESISIAIVLFGI